MSIKKTRVQEDREARAYNWGLLATVLLLLSLLAQAPARILAHFIPAGARASLLNWGGTIWSGQANWQYRQLQGQLRWRFDPLALLRLRLGLHCEWLTPSSTLRADLSLGAGGWRLGQASGSLAGADLQSVLASWQVPPAPIQVRSLELRHARDGWAGSSGQLEWQGGGLTYSLNGQKQQLALPPVVMAIQAEQGALQLLLRQQQGDGLAIFTLNGDMLQAQLKQRLLMFAPDYHGVAEPDAVVVTASQPLDSL